MSMPAQRDLILDFWRGIAILGVLMHHLFYFHIDFFRLLHTAGAGSTMFSAVLWQLNEVFLAVCVRSGPWGVKIFFIISGYIITKHMLEEEHVRGTLSLYGFYLRRIFRILPAYMLYLAVVVLAGATGLIALGGQELLAAATFICNSEISCYWYTSHTWTLAVEMQFYLVWPLLFLVIPARLREGFLLALLGALAVFSATGLFVTHTWLDNPLAFASIALGALCAVSVRTRTVLQTYGFYLAAVLAGGVAALYLFGGSEPARVLFRLAIPLWLVVCIFSLYARPRLTTLPAFNLIAGLGLVSYSLYLWQQFFLSPGGPQDILTLTLQGVVLTAITAVSYVYIEKPAQRFARRLLHARAKQDTPGI